MARLQRMLVATDLSPRADAALARAAQLTKEHGAALTVLHVLDGMAGNGPTASQMIPTAEASLRQKIATLPSQLEGAVTIRVVTGKPFIEIIRRAREEAADLIIVGAHGRHFLKDLLFGTTAEKVVRKGDRPVLVVKTPPQRPYARVLVPVDFSEDSRRALELALTVASHGECHVLHAYEGLFEGPLSFSGAPKQEVARYRRRMSAEARREMEAFLHNLECRDRTLRIMIRHGRAPHAILAAARRLHADLVSVGTTGRTGLPYILLGSVAEHVLRQAKCDVLVTRSAAAHFELP